MHNSHNKSSMMAEVDNIIDAAGEKFGFAEIKDHQRDGLKALIEGKDVFVAQPTGYGKSAIFHMAPYVKAVCQARHSMALPHRVILRFLYFPW